MNGFTPRGTGLRTSNKPSKSDLGFGVAWGCAFIAGVWLLSIAGLVVGIWWLIEYGIPWLIDVVMDAVENRD